MEYLKPEEKILVRFTTAERTRLIELYLKNFGFRDLSKIIYHKLPCTFPYFVIDTVNKTIDVFREEKDLPSYNADHDFRHIIQTITAPNEWEYINGTPFTC